MEVAQLFASLGLRPKKEEWDRGTRLIEGAKKAIVGLIGLQAVHWLAGTVEETINLGGELDDLRQKTGLTAEALQEYGYVAKLGGSSMQGFAGGVMKLARTMKEAKGGSKDAQQALAQVHITGAALTDALKGGDGLDQALMEIAGSFADMPDGPKKTALAMQLFGKSGAELIPTLNKGQQGLAELKQEAIDLGIVMSGDDVSGLDNLGDDIDKAKMSLTGLKNQAIVTLVPVLQEMVTGLLEWIKANRELVRSSLRSVVYGLAIAAKIAAKGFEFLAQAIDYLREHGDLARAILAAIIVVLVAYTAAAIAAWVATLGPIALIIAGLTAIALVVFDIWEAFTKGKGVTAAIARWIASQFHRIIDAIKGVVSAVGRFFASIATGIKDAFVAVFDWIADKLDWAWRQVKKVGYYATHPVQAFKAAAGEALGILNSPLMKAVASGEDPKLAAQKLIKQQSSTVNTTINVSSNATDPKAVAVETKAQFQQFWEQKMRDAHAGTGGDE